MNTYPRREKGHDIRCRVQIVPCAVLSRTLDGRAAPRDHRAIVTRFVGPERSPGPERGSRWVGACRAPASSLHSPERSTPGNASPVGMYLANSRRDWLMRSCSSCWIWSRLSTSCAISTGGESWRAQAICAQPDRGTRPPEPFPRSTRLARCTWFSDCEAGQPAYVLVPTRATHGAWHGATASPRSR